MMFVCDWDLCVMVFCVCVFELCVGVLVVEWCGVLCDLVFFYILYCLCICYEL